MGFKDIVAAAKKTPQRSVPTAPVQPKNLIEAEEKFENEAGASVEAKPAVQKKDISYKDSEIKGFVPQQRVFGSRQNNDPRQGSIIRNISAEADRSQQIGGSAHWSECRNRKEGFGKDFCKEYHSFCYKEKCNRAVK